MTDEERLTRMIEEAARGANAYVRIAACMVCGKQDDLRFGVCFGCADHVRVGELHRLWDERAPENTWFCDGDGNVVDIASIDLRKLGAR